MDVYSQSGISYRLYLSLSINLRKFSHLGGVTVACELRDSSNTVSLILFHSVCSSALNIKKSLNNPTFSASQQLL
jgi:hypothetical protein